MKHVSAVQTAKMYLPDIIFITQLQHICLMEPHKPKLVYLQMFYPNKLIAHEHIWSVAIKPLSSGSLQVRTACNNTAWQYY